MTPEPNWLKRLLRKASAPTLYRFNGCGFTILGWLHDRRMTPLYLTQHFATFLWVPIVPLSFYVVEDIEGGRFCFYGKIGMVDVIREFGAKKLFGFYLTVFMQSALWLITVVALLSALVWLSRHMRHFL